MRYSYTAQRTKNNTREKADHCTFDHGQGTKVHSCGPIAKTPLGGNNTFVARAPEALKSRAQEGVGGNAGERR
ncbi:hypothetical protein FJ970_17410 [Mesorhizobium sp. B2-1-8]|nr:hypothetical protein [Mesorhizobium sp. B2-1-8]UCI16919.1 hypothetical protein FJ970_17410 [Mesorhizobium sp. B2-1-8]